MLNYFFDLIVALSLIAPLAHAQHMNDRLIYEALAVPEVLATPPKMGLTQMNKSVGGLSCTETNVTMHVVMVTYHCTLDDFERDNAAIYNSLNVPIHHIASTEGHRSSEKTAGPLSCIQTEFRDGQSAYLCRLSK